MTSKITKKTSSINRVSSATPREAASLAASAHESKKPKFTIWPEWNDADVNAEKWDALKKEDKKGKSPTVAQHYYEDPDGKIEMPSSMKVDSWKRPVDFITDKVPVVVDTDHIAHGFDLIANNEHLHESELLRYCIGQITALWNMSAVKGTPEQTADPASPGDDPNHSWKPWEHIYSLSKAGKGSHLPLFNSYGKYVVRLHWMGSWRKIIVDDTIPFDDQGKMLLPGTTLGHELWPMLLVKALIKISSLDYGGGNPSQEFGDMSVMHCLTGWIPETIPLQEGALQTTPADILEQRYCSVMDSFPCAAQPSHISPCCFHQCKIKPPKQGHIKKVWELIRSSLPEWKLPEQDLEKPPDEIDLISKESTPSESLLKEDKLEKEPSQKDLKEVKDKGKEGKGGKDKDKNKDDKKDKKDKEKEKEKDKGKEKLTSEDFVLPDKPEIVMFATYSSTPKYPVKVSVLGQMADASERLRQNGLSHLYPHPVCITQTRSCPLEPPPPPVVIPAWKLIRPRKKKTPPHDEPIPEIEPPKEIRCLEITSAFVNYKVSPVPIPTDTHRPKSSLERGGSKSRAENDVAIEETDENAPSPPLVTPEPEILTPVEEPMKEEEDLSKDKTGSGKRRSSSKERKSKPNSASKEKLNSGKRPESRHSIRGDENRSDRGKNESVQMTLIVTPSGNLAAVRNSASATDWDIFTEEEETGMEMPVDNNPKPKKKWMDFETFCKCFKTLHIFHKSHTYLCNQKFSDLKGVTPAVNAPQGKADKKPTQQTSAPGDGSPFYLFVDNLAPTDILVSFSVLPRWFEPPPPPMEEKKSSLTLKQSKEKDFDKDPTNASISMESLSEDQKSEVPILPGTLVAEPYSWKSLVTGQPILRLKTSGTKSTVLSLPPGRHVLRFIMTSSLGHNIQMCSTVNFVFGDEETVMSQLTNESCRFRENATQVINSLGKCIEVFNNPEIFNVAFEDLKATHCPFLTDKHISKTQHFQNFIEALYQMLQKTLKDIVSPDVAFSWRAFTYDLTTPNILALPVGSRPVSTFPALRKRKESRATATPSVRGSASKPSNKRHKESAFGLSVSSLDAVAALADSGEAEKPENPWSNREPTIEEQIAAVKLQTAWRGFRTQKLRKAREAGTEENIKAHENLKKSWALIEANVEENGLLLLREMFKKDPDIMHHYPFYKDEWNKISYADYKGVFPDEPSMNWFVVFREIFYVKEEMLVVPKLYVPIKTCMLRVIDNDTNEEIPRVFQKVAPYIYKKNKKGYSFVAEARTIEQPLLSGNWRMRLIGSLTALPAPVTGEVCSNFITKEIRDYYVPNPKNIIFRQSVKVTEDHFVSLQVNTSKHDVYVKLSVLDNEEEVISAVGKGHVVIPAFTFLKDITQEDIDNRRSNSRGSVRGGLTAPAKTEKNSTKLKRTESAVSNEQPPSRSSMRSDAELAERLEEARPHKYVIQATMLQNSWPLSESSWQFVQMLKEMEKNDLKVSNKERPVSPPKAEKAPAAAAGKGKPKMSMSKGGGKEKVSESRASRPQSQAFDITKPNWTLRVVSDTSAAEEIEVKKDTERADEIRAMKKAWEDAQPGRAAKALQSRLKYLNSHTIRLQGSRDEQPTSVSTTVSELGISGFASDLEQMSMIPISYDSETVLTLEPPSGPAPKEMLEPLDVTPFIKKTLSKPRYLDEEEKERVLERRQREIAEYKAFREGVEKWREADKINRNKTKIEQLEQCQALQATLDAARERINISREAIRQQFLEKEKLRLEEMVNREAAMKAEMDSKSPKLRKKSAGGKKKK